MRVIIAGSRNIRHMGVLKKAIEESGFDITVVVCGMSDGVDLLGLEWAELNKVPVVKMPAEWTKFGKAAGPVRNEKMAAFADALIAVHDGESKGTLNMIRVATKKGLKVHTHLYKSLI